MSIPTIDETINLREVRCVVAGVNASGEPDFYFVKVECTEEEYDNGEHYACAKQAANDAGYKPYLAYDEQDAGGRAMMDLFEWDTASVYAVGYGLQRGERRSRAVAGIERFRPVPVVKVPRERWAAIAKNRVTVWFTDFNSAQAHNLRWKEDELVHFREVIPEEAETDRAVDQIMAWAYGDKKEEA